MKERINISARVTLDCRAQLDRLAETLNIPKSSVIALAIARMYHDEPLVKKETTSDGDRHAGL